MSLVIDLPSTVEVCIEREAQKAGVTPSELVAEVVARNFASPFNSEEQARLNASSISLLESWLEEAKKPRAAQDLVDAEEDIETLMHNLNTTRREAGERLHFPEVADES